MTVGDFEVICNKCGSKKVAITNYHNTFEEGIRFKCKECGAMVTL